MLTPEATSRIQTIRRKILDGTATREDQIEGIRLLQADRTARFLTAKERKAAEAKEAKPPAGPSLLDRMKAAATAAASTTHGA